MVTEIPNVDPAIWALYNQDPTNFLLLGVAADQAREVGDEDTGRFLDMCYRRKLYPTYVRNNGGWGWWQYLFSDVACMIHMVYTYSRSSAYRQLVRLYDAWVISSENNKEASLKEDINVQARSTCSL